MERRYRFLLLATMLIVSIACGAYPKSVDITGKKAMPVYQETQTALPVMTQTPMTTTITETYRVTGSWHVRDAPGIYGEVIAIVTDQDVTVIRKRGEWYRVIYPVIGWINEGSRK